MIQLSEVSPRAENTAREGGAQQPAANHRSPHKQPAESGRALAGRGGAQGRARFVVSPGDIGSEEEADGGKDAGADDYHYDSSELSRASGGWNRIEGEGVPHHHGQPHASRAPSEAFDCTGRKPGLLLSRALRGSGATRRAHGEQGAPIGRAECTLHLRAVRLAEGSASCFVEAIIEDSAERATAGASGPSRR